MTVRVNSSDGAMPQVRCRSRSPVGLPATTAVDGVRAAAPLRRRFKYRRLVMASNLGSIVAASSVGGESRRALLDADDYPPLLLAAGHMITFVAS